MSAGRISSGARWAVGTALFAVVMVVLIIRAGHTVHVPPPPPPPLEGTVVRGEVTKKLITIGSMGGGNAAVVAVGDDVWTQVQVGQRARLMADVVPGLDLAAKVQNVSPYVTIINQQRGYHYVNIEITDPVDPRLAPSQTVRVIITTLDEPNVLVVPNTAVTTDGSQSFVTGVDGRRLPFTPGAVGDALTEVRAGLTEGQPIRMR
ncbi:MAG TPA: hypothetical protein VL595_07900 [Pseudonocardia sp.]|nr:hypothetical protein [Pseudonocardia sp.]